VKTLHLLLRLAVRNVRRGWRHSIAAIGTMAIGFVALATFQGYLSQLLESQIAMNYARNMIGDFMVRKPGGGSVDARVRPDKYWLDEKDQAFVQAWVKRQGADVRAAMRALLVEGVANAGPASASFMLFGHDIAEGHIARRDWQWYAWAGRPARPDEPNAVVAGLGLGQSLGCVVKGNPQIFDPRTARPIAAERPMDCKTTSVQLSGSSPTGRVNALDGEIVGLTSGGVREFDQRLLWGPLSLAQDLASTKGVDSFQIVLADPGRAPALIERFSAEAKAAGLHLQAVDWQQTEQADLLNRGRDMMSIYRNLVVFVLLVIAGSAVLTTMAKTVRERTREIGTLRSLGFRKGHMLAMFALEAGVLAVVSGVLGAVVATGLRLAVDAAGITYRAGMLAEDIPLTIGWSGQTYAAGFAFLAAVAVLAGWVAARRVVELRVAEALLGEH